MSECSRLGGVHPNAIHPKLWESRRPKACREHIMGDMKNHRVNFREHMDRMKDAKKTLDMKIKSIKSINDSSREVIDKAMNEFQTSMESLKMTEDNGCKPPSLYLPEFGKEFTDEPCPYAKES